MRFFWIGAAALAAALAATAGWADEINAPIAIAVTSSLEGEKGLSRILSAAGRGDVADTAREVESLLAGPNRRWARIVSEEPEAIVVIENRERVERSRSRDKKGNITINHTYRAEGAVEIDRRRSTIRAEVDFSEGPYSTRNDDEQFRKVAEKLVAEVSGVIWSSLDDLRPNRPSAGFEHQAKHKMFFKGDGLEVTAVEPGSPAEQAGLQLKDRIRRIDDEKGTDQMDARVRTWWTESPGTRVALEVERNKQRQNLSLTLAPRGEWSGASHAAAPAHAAPAAASSAPAGASSLRRTGGSKEPARSSVELKPGMSESEVARLLGQPKEKVAFGAKSLWKYDGYSVTFQNGKVIDMK
jgi:hypothetical protein